MPSDMEITWAPFSTAQLMASAIWSLDPPPVPRTFPINAFLTPGATPMRVPLTSRPKMVPAQCVPWPCWSFGPSRCEILLDESHTGERGMAGIDASVKNRDHDSVARERRGCGADGVDAPGGSSGSRLRLSVRGERLDKLHRHRRGNGDDIRFVGERFDFAVTDLFHLD